MKKTAVNDDAATSEITTEMGLKSSKMDRKSLSLGSKRSSNKFRGSDSATSDKKSRPATGKKSAAENLDS